MSLDQFVSYVHDKGSRFSPDAIANYFRKNKGLEACSLNAISNACKALAPNLYPVGHGCVLCAPNLAVYCSVWDLPKQAPYAYLDSVQ